MKTMTTMILLGSVAALAVLSGCQVSPGPAPHPARTSDQADQWWAHENPTLARGDAPTPAPTPAPLPTPPPASPDFQTWSPENPTASPGVAGE